MTKKWKEAHSVWGLSLDQYLGELPCDQVSATRASRHQISEAFDMLIEGYPTCATFELLLSLPDRPKLVQHFLDYHNKDLIPGCVDLLQRYCEANVMFDHAYGLLCLRTLILLLQVALVHCLNLRIWSNTDRKSDERRFAELLSKSLAQCVARNDLSASHHGKQYLQDLHWDGDPEDQELLACLSSFGGLNWNELSSVVGMLFTNTGPLQSILSSSGIPGFGTLLFLFWQYLVYRDPNDICYGFLLDLTIRYWPSSLPAEHDLLGNAFDALALVDRYADILPKPSHKGGLLTLNQAASMAELFHTAPIVFVPGRIAPLALSSLDRCWAELQTQTPSTEDAKTIVRLFQAAVR
ncbi:hypothetical protein FS749_003484 [Ceratobasidium sp. UAMH 11750]|nr:hypothetical protein FS749_003484 [Ceratobasidium sp. UAMH 11750]